MNYLKEIGKALLISIVIFFVIALVNYIIGNPQLNYEWLQMQFIYILVYTVTIYFANALIFIQLDKVFAKNRFHLKRMLIGFLTSFFVSIFIIFCLRMIEQVGIENKALIEF